MTFVWAFFLFLMNLIGWGSNFFSLPGNWLVLMFSLVYAFALPNDATPQLTWTILILALLLAIMGEIWEFMAGAAGATKRGGSRRGAIFAIIGSLVGSVAGAFVGIPIPVVGPMIGALGGGAAGAFAGAYLGEQNRPHKERLDISKGAFVGRMLGTGGKLVFGLLMVIMITIDSFFDF